MDERDLDLGTAFDAARELTEPTIEDRARIRAALAAKLGAAALLAAAPAKSAIASAAVAQGAVHGAKLAIATQLAPALLAGAVLGAAAAWTGSTLVEPSAPTPAPPPVLATPTAAPGPPPTTLAQPVAPPVPVNGELPAADPVTALPPPAALDRQAAPKMVESAASGCTGSACGPALRAFPEADPRHEASELGGELALISRMHAAWRARDFASVASAIRAHEQQFATGNLVEEREAMKVMLLCRTSASARAAELGAAYVKDHVGSPYSARVNAACSGRAEPR